MAKSNAKADKKQRPEVDQEDETFIEQEELVSGSEDSPADQEALQAELEKLAQQNQQLQDKYLRAHAEMENMRRVAEEDVRKAHKFALESFVKDLLPVVDSLESALAAHDHDDPNQKKLCEGIELTLSELLKVLNKAGVEQIDPLDQAFDPDLHQAIGTETDQDKPANTVVKVLQKGYSLKQRLIRPALVMVSKT